MNVSISTKIIAGIACAITLFSSCENSPYPGYEVSESGLYSKFYTHDEAGVSPKEGDIVRVAMQYYITRAGKDSLLFDTKDPKYNQSGTNYVEFPLSKSTFKGSFEDALASMAVGDSASFKISADSVYLKTFQVPANEMPAYIEKGSIMTFEAKLLKITSKEEAAAEQEKKMQERNAQMALLKDEEMTKLAQYIADNKITTKPTESGLYYIELKKGKGATLKNGDATTINYTGMFVDGTVFDTSIEAVAKQANMYDERRPYGPYPCTVGQLVPGFNEALLKMSEGTKAKLIIPSSIGYGDGGGRFTPFATLIFEVEVGAITTPAK